MCQAGFLEREKGVTMWKTILDRMLIQLIREGSLTVQYPDGTTRHYGDGSLPAVAVRIIDPAIMRRMVRNPALALG